MPIDTLIALAMQSEEVRWIAPPRGSVRHGIFWTRHPRIALVLALSAMLFVLGAALYRRFRRK